MSQADVVKPIFTAAGINAVPHCLAWRRGRTNTGNPAVAAYGSHHAIHIVDPITSVVLRSLPGHTQNVVAVTWIGPAEDLLASCSSDGTVRVWDCHDTDMSSWKCLHILDTGSPVICIAACFFRDSFSPASCAVIAGFTLKGETMLWKVGNRSAEVAPAFVIAQRSSAILQCLAIEQLNDTQLLLFGGGVDCNVHAFLVDVLPCGKAQKEQRQMEESPLPLSGKALGVLPGHQTWVHALALRKLFKTKGIQLEADKKSDSERMLLASGAKEIRLWMICPCTEGPDEESRIQFGAHTNSETEEYMISFEAMLVSHDDLVTGLEWRPPASGSGEERETEDGADLQGFSYPILLSSALDRSVCLWRADAEAGGAWAPIVQLGDLGGAHTCGSVGSSPIGFLGASFGDHGLAILAYGHSGSFELWRQQLPNVKAALDDANGDHLVEEVGKILEVIPSSGDEITSDWNRKGTVSGHFGSVTDISWASDGDYLLSVSSDKTCRLWGCTSHGWYEVGRPQMHGYDMVSVSYLANLEGDNSNHRRYVSAADESVLRVFEAPRSVLLTLPNMSAPSRVSPSPSLQPALQFNADSLGDDLAFAAYVPELSLSNRAIEYDDNSAPPEIPVLSVPLLECELRSQTLWLEHRKLFGHGEHIMLCRVNHAGTLIASSSKARDEESAAVKIWDLLQQWRSSVTLYGHSSTVVDIAWSHSDNYLVTVSKDRAICVFANRSNGGGGVHNGGGWILAVKVTSAHKRIIWACSWSSGDELLATASRDGFVKVWTLTTKAWEGEEQTAPKLSLLQVASFKPSDCRSGDETNSTDNGSKAKKSSSTTPSAVTAIAFCPTLRQGRSILAVGLESGSMSLFHDVGIKVGVKSESSSIMKWELLFAIPAWQCHVAAVSRMSWRPCPPFLSSSPEDYNVLASCSADHSIRLFAFQTAGESDRAW